MNTLTESQPLLINIPESETLMTVFGHSSLKLGDFAQNFYCSLIT